MRAQAEDGHLQAQERGLRTHPPADTWLSDIQPPGCHRTHFCCLICSVSGCLYQQPEQTHFLMVLYNLSLLSLLCPPPTLFLHTMGLLPVTMGQFDIF